MWHQPRNPLPPPPSISFLRVGQILAIALLVTFLTFPPSSVSSPLCMQVRFLPTQAFLPPIYLLSSLHASQVPPNSSLSSPICLLSFLHVGQVPPDSILCANVFQVHGSQHEALTPIDECPTSMARPNFKVWKKLEPPGFELLVQVLLQAKGVHSLMFGSCIMMSFCKDEWGGVKWKHITKINIFVKTFFF